ncbi:MAG: hypothetical protein FD180_769 [Planctomycetota bacterium]|nr:MAG: hypothetical protein FD180_769 [Planctomycetota bacterium]
MPEDRREMSSRATWIGGALIALLLCVVIGLPILVRTKHENRQRECQDRLRRIGVCFETYHSRYAAWPIPDEKTWFGALWTSGIATDAEVFRCPFVNSRGPGTHFRGIVGPGVMPPAGSGATYVWLKTGITPGAPPDFPMALDDDYNGSPNHGANSDRNILYFQGHVARFSVGSADDGYFTPLTGSTTSGWAAPAGTK